MQNLTSIIKNFSKAKVLVVGDVMLDQYWWGSVERISPEAPVPVVRLQKKSLVVGGAANVAANIAGLGAEPILIGCVGDDDEAGLLKPLLKKLKISSSDLVTLKNRPTTLKTRVVAHNQHVVRIDQENSFELDENQQERVWLRYEKKLEKAQLVIISDYAKGLLTKKLVSRLITSAIKKNKIVLVDPKGKDYSKYSGAFLLTPNRLEAAQSCNLSAEGQDIVEKAGKMLIEEFNFESVLITQGENGMTLFGKNKESFHLNALARKVYDVTGAGDTVIAVLGVAIASGADLKEAAQIANVSAGIVVEEIGTTNITIEKLTNFLTKKRD